jgi:hypothetical protein
MLAAAVKRVLLGLFGVLCAGVCLHALTGRAAPTSPVHGPRLEPARSAQPAAAAEEPAPAQPSAADAQLRYLLVGGGATPEYTEISLEQDLELASKALHGPGLTLFAGGEGSESVRVQGPLAGQPSLLARLGELFDPRGGRSSHYQRARLSAQSASATNFETSFSLAASSGKQPLVVYIASHGLQGSEARDNYVELWGGDPLSVTQLADMSASAARPLRFVIASCYSGGFAELAFEKADPQQGPTRSPRCGLFAGTWDRQTSGCDPNPDRRAQEGYSLHLLHALRGEDRDGKPLPRASLDLDGDGKISLLEAHTRARIASHSIDVPTTTSERYLREVVRTPAALNPKLLPEDATVIKQLGARLNLPTESAANKRYKELSERLDAVQEELDAAEDDLEQARGRLGAQLLARWPVLNDAYHEEFARVLARDGKAIEQVLEQSQKAQLYREARDQADALSARAGELDPQEAEVLRLLRAYETLGLASALAARGGEDYAHYRRLLSCERTSL